MAITLYGFGLSRSFRDLWALEEAQLDYDYISLKPGSPDEGGSKSADYFKLNAQGKVPTLVDNDFVLSESAAIINYINALSETSFIPDDAQKRAKYDELCYFILTELEQPLWTMGKHKFAIPQEHRVKKIFPTAAWEFAKAQDSLSKLVNLHDHSFALGEEFSFADILLAHTINWADSIKIAIEPNYLAYRDRILERPAYQRALMKANG